MLWQQNPKNSKLLRNSSNASKFKAKKDDNKSKNPWKNTKILRNSANASKCNPKNIDLKMKNPWENTKIHGIHQMDPKSKAKKVV